MPANKQIECVLHDPKDGIETVQETASLTPRPGGDFTGVFTTTIISNECGDLGNVTTVPIIATKTGAAPAFSVPAPDSYPAAPDPAVVPVLPVQAPDPKDLLFLSKLADHGIPTTAFVHGSLGASAAGRETCHQIDQGYTIDSVIDSMHGAKGVMTLTTDQANFAVHAAIDVYCPAAAGQ